MGKGLNRQFSKEDMQVAEQLMKSCSASSGKCKSNHSEILLHTYQRCHQKEGQRASVGRGAERALGPCCRAPRCCSHFGNQSGCSSQDLNMSVPNDPAASRPCKNLCVTVHSGVSQAARKRNAPEVHQTAVDG